MYTVWAFSHERQHIMPWEVQTWSLLPLLFFCWSHVILYVKIPVAPCQVSCKRTTKYEHSRVYYHIVIEFLSWKGLLEAICSNPPAVNRGTYSYISLLRALSNLAVNVSLVDGASTASLDNLCQCFTALIVINFFLIQTICPLSCNVMHVEVCMDYLEQMRNVNFH